MVSVGKNINYRKGEGGKEAVAFYINPYNLFDFSKHMNILFWWKLKAYTFKRYTKHRLYVLDKEDFMKKLVHCTTLQLYIQGL